MLGLWSLCNGREFGDNGFILSKQYLQLAPTFLLFSNKRSTFKWYVLICFLLCLVLWLFAHFFPLTFRFHDCRDCILLCSRNFIYTKIASTLAVFSKNIWNYSFQQLQQEKRSFIIADISLSHTVSISFQQAYINMWLFNFVKIPVK